MQKSMPLTLPGSSSSAFRHICWSAHQQQRSCWFLFMKLAMSMRPASTAQELRSLPLISLNMSDGLAEVQAVMNCTLQCQCIIASMMAAWPRSGVSIMAAEGARVTMKQAAEVLPC